MIFKKKTGILLLLLLFVGCTSTKFTTQKPRPSKIVPPVSLQSTATPEFVAATEDITIFSKGNMTMICIPSGKILMGSTESQIDTAIAYNPENDFVILFGGFSKE